MSGRIISAIALLTAVPLGLAVPAAAAQTVPRVRPPDGYVRVQAPPDENAAAPEIVRGDTPQDDASGDEASASDLKAAIEAIKSRLSKQQEGRQTSGTGQLAAELRSARETIGQLTDSMGRLRAERDQMLNELRLARDEAAERSGEIANLERGLEEARGDAATRLADLRGQLDRQGAARKRLEGEQNQLRAQLEGTLKEIDDLTTLAEQARKERDDVEQALAKVRDDASQEMSTRDEALASAQQQLGELEKRLAERNARADVLNRDLSDLRQELTAVSESAGASAREAKETGAALEQTTVRLAAEQKALKEARSETARLNEEIRKVEQAAESRIRERTTVLTGNLDKAEAQIAALETEMGELRSVAAASVAEVQNLGEQLLLTLQENDELLAALAEVRGAKDLLVGELTAARDDARIYAEEASRLRKGEEGGGPDVGQLRQALRDAQDEIDVLTNQLIVSEQQVSTAAADGDVTALNQQVTTLERQLQASEAEKTALEAQVDLPGAGAPIVATVPPEENEDALVARLNGAPAEDGWTMTRPDGIVFAAGSEALADGGEAALGEVAALIRLTPEGSPVRVVGHTDAFGDDAINQRLSLRRAETVARTLAARYGIEPGRLQAEGLGEAEPIAPNSTREGRRLNRRVEVFVRR